MMTSRTNMAIAALSVSVALPGAYFVLGNILKYHLGILQAVEIYEFPPAVVLGGLALGFAMNLIALLWPAPIRMTSWSRFRDSVSGRKMNAVLLSTLGICLLVLLLYVVSENLLERLSA